MGRLKDKPSNIVYDFYGVNQNGDESPLNFLSGGIIGAGRFAAGLNKSQGFIGDPTERSEGGAQSAARGIGQESMDAMTARNNFMQGIKAQEGGDEGGIFGKKVSRNAPTIKTIEEQSNVPLSGHSSSQMNKPVEESTQPIVGTGGVTAAVNIPVPEVIPEQGGGGGTGPGGTKKRYILTEE